MKCGISLVVGAAVLLAIAVTAAAPAAPEDWVLFDAPRGAWLASVRHDTPVVVLEEREGWRRVRIEGWIAAAPGAPPPPTPSPDEGAPGATVEGTLAPAPGESGAPATRSVLLVSGLQDLDRRHRDLGSECRPPIEAGAARLADLRKEMGEALNSSDNFRQAMEAKNEARAALGRAEREQQDRVTACRIRAEDLFQQHAVRRGFADSSGRFVFESVPPGDYRVIAFDPGGNLSLATALESRVAAPGRVVLSPESNRSAMEPFWGLR